MQLQTDTAKVSVSGTVTDFGSSFRSVGLAVGIEDVIEARAIAGPTRLTLTGEASDDPSIRGLAADDHPTVHALRSLLDTVGSSQVGLHLQYRGRVPTVAGLGTRTNQILAGLLLGRQLLGEPESLSDSLMESMAVSLGANRLRVRAILGGPLVVGLPDPIRTESDFSPGRPLAWLGGGANETAPDSDAARPYWQGEVAPPISPSAFVPSVRVGARSRPEKIPKVAHFSDAADTAGRAGMLVAALLGASTTAGTLSEGALQELLLAATVDELRQADTKERLPASFALVQWLQSLGIPAFISGEGPAVITLLPLPREVVGAAERSGWRYFDMGVATRQGETLVAEREEVELQAAPKAVMREI